MQTSTVNRAIVWGLLAVAAVANIAGYALDLYRRLWWFDEVLHGATIAAITLALGLALYGKVLLGARDSPLLLVAVLAAIGLALGALWEVAEWGFDQAVSGDVIKGKRDTMLDLVMDGLGALAAGIAVLVMVDDPRAG